MTSDIDLGIFISDDEPSPADLAAAPLLDPWQPVREWAVIRLFGPVTGHPDHDDGSRIVTSMLKAIARDFSWAKSHNRVYRLGRLANVELPALLQVAAAEDWIAAASIACRISHRVRDVLGERAIRLVDHIAQSAPGMDWKQRRDMCLAIAEEACNRIRIDIGDLWLMLAADPHNPESFGKPAVALDHSLYDWTAADETTQLAKQARQGWMIIASGHMATVAKDDQDPIVAARQASAMTALLGCVTDPVIRRNIDCLAYEVAASCDAGLLAKATGAVLAPLSTAGPLCARAIEWHLTKSKDRAKAAAIAEDLRRMAEDLLDLDLRSDCRGLADAWLLMAADVNDQASCIAASGAVIRAAVTKRIRIAPSLRPALMGECTKTALGWALLAAAPNDMLPYTNFADILEIAAELGDLAADELAPVKAAKPPAAPEEHGIIVLKEVGGTTLTSSGKEAQAEFKSIVNERLPLRETPDLGPVRAGLLAEFPYAENAIDTMLSDLSGSRWIHFRPTLLLGEPGGGKTRLIRFLGSALSLHVARYDASGSSDNSFGGTARRWSSGEPCHPLSAIRTAGIANPLVHIDEIDKAGTSHNGNLWNALLPMTETESAARFNDPYCQSDCDLSRVSYLLTANDVTCLPAPLRDRLRIIRIARPGREHLPALARRIVKDLATEQGLEPGFVLPLDGDETEIACRLWEGGSIRQLKNIVERLLALREKQAARH